MSVRMRWTRHRIWHRSWKY